MPTRTHPIVAVSGKMRSGKDEFAKVFIRETVIASVAPPFIKFGFADILRSEVAAFLGLPLEEVEARKEEFRPALIALGNKHRAEDPQYLITRLLSINAPLLIPDLRMPDEYAALQAAGAVLVRVNASEPARRRRDLVIRDPGTENGLDHGYAWDYVLENDGGLEHYHLQCLEAIQLILHRLYP